MTIAKRKKPTFFDLHQRHKLINISPLSDFKSMKMLKNARSHNVSWITTKMEWLLLSAEEYAWWHYIKVIDFHPTMTFSWIDNSDDCDLLCEGECAVWDHREEQRIKTRFSCLAFHPWTRGHSRHTRPREIQTQRAPNPPECALWSPYVGQDAISLT